MPWEIEPGHTLEEWSEAALQLSKVPAIHARKKAEHDYYDKFRRAHKDYASIHYRH